MHYTPTQVGSDVTTGGKPTSVAWSSDGKFIVTVSEPSGLLQIFSFDGYNSPVPGSGILTFNHPYSVSWSPDGKFIAVTCDLILDSYYYPTLFIYSFNGYSIHQVGVANNLGVKPKSVSWSPDSSLLPLYPIHQIHSIFFNQ